MPAALHQRTTQQLTIMHAEGISNERRQWGEISSRLHSTVKTQKAITQKIHIFSQLHAVIFEQNIHFHLESLKHFLFQLLHPLFSPSFYIPFFLCQTWETLWHQSAKVFCLFVFLCKTILGYFPISGAVLGPTTEVTSSDPSIQLSHLALYYTFQYVSDVF